MIGEDDRIGIVGLADLAPGEPVTVMVTKPGGQVVEISCTHTMSEDQIAWFRAGSALNIIRTRTAG